MLTLALTMVLLAVPAPPHEIEAARLVDLTHPFDATTIYWPTAPGFRLETVASGHTDGGFWYAANDFCAAEHGGTHLDAPIHFAAGRWTAEAAAWLTTARRLRAIGIDTASIDHGPSRDFRAHRTPANANVPIFENLRGLDALPTPRGRSFSGCR